MIELIFLLFLNWFMVLIGFNQKDYTITGVSAFFMMSLSIYSLSLGTLGNIIAPIMFFTGFYILVRSVIEISKFDPEEESGLKNIIRKLFGGKKNEHIKKEGNKKGR